MPVPVGWAQGWEDCRHGNGGWGRRAGWGRFGAVLLGVIMFSACGGSLRVPSAPRSVVTLRLTGRAAGSVVAASLLVAVPLPRSARPTSAVPSSYLTTPAQSPASVDLIDLHRLVTVALPPETAASAIETSAKRPFMRVSGIGSESGPAGAALLVQVTITPHGATAPSVAQEELVYTVVGTSASASEIRVDAHVVWVPVLTNADQVPSPKSAVITVYQGGSYATGPLDPRTITVSGSAAQRLASTVDQLPGGNPPGCMEDLTGWVITFSPRAGGAPTVVTSDGCMGRSR